MTTIEVSCPTCATILAVPTVQTAIDMIEVMSEVLSANNYAFGGAVYCDSCDNYCHVLLHVSSHAHIEEGI